MAAMDITRLTNIIVVKLLSPLYFFVKVFLYVLENEMIGSRQVLWLCYSTTAPRLADVTFLAYLTR